MSLCWQTVIMLTGVTMITIQTVNTWMAKQVLIVLLPYTTPKTLPVFTLITGTLAQIWI